MYKLWLFSMLTGSRGFDPQSNVNIMDCLILSSWAKARSDQSKPGFQSTVGILANPTAV